MPKIKYADFSRTIEKAGAFSFRVAEARLGEGYAKTFVHNLRKKGKITELMKGWYTFRNSPYLITIPLGEAYVGLGTAAYIHGAWKQVPNVDILTTRASQRIRAGERIVGGRKVIVRRISREMYFGYEQMVLEEAGGPVRVSDPEKTLIDIIYYNYPFADEIIPGLKEIIKKEKIDLYLKQMGSARGSGKIRKRVAEVFGDTGKEGL
jgi:predicted transcriptional regulator of viral defense system